MSAAAESYRQQSCATLRSICQMLRDEVLLDLGFVVFGELQNRSQEELHDKAGELRKAMAKTLAIRDRERLEHEKRLTPGLANPNAAAELQALCDSEKTRHEKAVECIEATTSEFLALLTEEATSVSNKFHVTFDKLLRVLDSLPLPTHFNELPGDTALEPKRMSIKRRLRRVASGHPDGTPIIVDDEVLPDRTWEGLPKTLHQLEDPDFWSSKKEDEEEKEEENKFFPEIKSFRSPVHKKIFHRRNETFTNYSEEFREQTRAVVKDLKARMTKEVVGKENWEHMIHQLEGTED